MIKTILAWITGKNNRPAEAPYKIEAITPMPLGTEAVMSLQATHNQVVASGQPDDSKGLDAAIAAQALQAAHDQVVVNGQPDDSKGLDEAIAAQAAKSAVEVAPVTVKAKYKRADLNKMTKAQLMELVTKHGVEVKARSTKEELVKVLVKV